MKNVPLLFAPQRAQTGLVVCGDAVGFDHLLNGLVVGEAVERAAFQQRDGLGGIFYI